MYVIYKIEREESINNLLDVMLKILNASFYVVYPLNYNPDNDPEYVVDKDLNVRLTQCGNRIRVAFEGELAKITAKELAAVFAQIPLDAETVQISGKGFSEISADKLALGLKGIRATVHSVEFDGFSFVNTPTNYMIAIFAALSRTLKSVDIESCELGRRTAAESIAMLKAFPKTLESLKLNRDCSEISTNQELIAIFGALPPRLTYLGYNRGHGLSLKSSEELVEIFKASPKSLKSLKLIDHCPAVNIHPGLLSQLLKGIELDEINVIGHLAWAIGLFNASRELPLFRIMSSLPSHIDTLTFNNTTRQCNEVWVENLLESVDEVLKNMPYDASEFLFIEFPVKIDELRLGKFIEILEKLNTSTSLLTCGLLLEGSIRNLMPQETPEDPKRYLEKRVQDAVSFYLRAAASVLNRRLLDLQSLDYCSFKGFLQFPRFESV